MVSVEAKEMLRLQVGSSEIIMTPELIEIKQGGSTIRLDASVINQKSGNIHLNKDMPGTAGQASKINWPEDVPEPVDPTKPELNSPPRQKSTYEKMEDWSRAAGQTNEAMMEDMFGDSFDNLDEAKSSYNKGDVAGASAAVGMAAVGMVDPTKKGKAVKRAVSGGKRTKHIDNRHINRSKYPEKSKFSKPNQIEKLNKKTVNKPDQVIKQNNGRVRYEKDFKRDIGTRGERTNVSVVDEKKGKRVTQFPKQ